MSKHVKIQHLSAPLSGDIRPSSSKSESNRALIIQALSEEPITLHNLSAARDTQTMQHLLASIDPELDVLDAGTTMRFLIAFCTVRKQGKIIKGTDRMHQRPVKILVEALQELGDSIEYLGQEGYPPVFVRGFLSEQEKEHIRIQGNVSSQYISALLMVAPILKKGLVLELLGKIGSRPYINMTLSLMQQFGIRHQWQENRIYVPSQAYRAGTYTIESDWSGASYWYSVVALAEQAQVKLLGLRRHSFQGDIVIADIMQHLGVASDFQEDGVVLSKKATADKLTYDFSDCPDLAQTVAAVCAAKGVRCTMLGLESLRIKETDRILALQTELAKIGASLEEKENRWELVPGHITSPASEPIVFDTYDDHRMAMALAPLATRMPVIIHEPDVVNKSYPSYWQDMQQMGFELSFGGGR